MFPKLIAINKTLLSVYSIEDSYYIDIKEANAYSKRVEISNLPQLTRHHVTFIELNAFTEFLSSIKSPTFLEQQTIDAIKKQWNFDLAEEGLAEEEVENNQPQKDDYFIKY